MTIDLFDPTTLLDQPQTSEKPELPVLITARFEVQSDRAALEISANNMPAVFIQVIHEGRMGVESEVIRGDQTGKPILVHDAEGIVLIARHEGSIIANAFFEVRMSLVESIDVLLSPASTVNMLVEQHNTGRSERRIDRQARRWQIEVPNVEIPDLEETIRVEAVKVEVAR